MNTTDPIADMLTRIRNANSSKHKTVDVPASNMKKSIADILFKEGYIAAYEEIENSNQGIIRITLKYDEKGARVIDGLKRISKPGLRITKSIKWFGNSTYFNFKRNKNRQRSKTRRSWRRSISLCMVSNTYKLGKGE